jgi:hypothetical protein
MALDLYVADKLLHLPRPESNIRLAHQLAWERERMSARRLRNARLFYRLGGLLAAPGLWLQRRSLTALGQPYLERPRRHDAGVRRGRRVAHASMRVVCVRRSRHARAAEICAP